MVNGYIFLVCIYYILCINCGSGYLMDLLGIYLFILFQAPTSRTCVPFISISLVWNGVLL